MTPNISYPRLDSISGRYLGRFLQGETLKHREADQATGSYRLASYVCYLQKKHGWIIERRDVCEETHDPTGRDANYREYWLPNWLIDRVGTTGQEYIEKVFEMESRKIAARLAATTPTASAKPSRTDADERNTEPLKLTIDDVSDDETE